MLVKRIILSPFAGMMMCIEFTFPYLILFALSNAYFTTMYSFVYVSSAVAKDKKKPSFNQKITFKLKISAKAKQKSFKKLL